MRSLALLCALVLSTAAAAQEALPPPPPPPPVPDGYEPQQQPPASPAPAVEPERSAEPADAARGRARRRGKIGEAPIAPAGAQAAPLHPDETLAHWRFALATGVAGRFGGRQLEEDEENPGVLLYFGGQADGLWTEGYGRAARIRFRMFTGGESEIYFPSDGDVEAAYMIGRREFRFVVGRAEVGRYPALGVEYIIQAATLPSFEGSVPLARDTMRLYYYVSPVAASYVRYYGGAHIPGSAAEKSETDSVVAATAGRMRYTLLLPSSMLLSLQGDLLKMWQKADMLAAAEASLGYQILDQTAVFNAIVRWNGYTRRGHELNTSVAESEVVLTATATLVF